MTGFLSHRGVWVKTLLVFVVETGIIFSISLLMTYVRFGERYEEILTAQRGLYKIAMTTFVSQFIFYLFSLYDISKPRLKRELLMGIFEKGFERPSPVQELGPGRWRMQRYCLWYSCRAS
ncbi:MAG: hypothetical protein EBZ36_08490 [Acidobacteria bacterium]|nr:hypothetical protein [Acidobacteriota bacterium]